MALIPIRARRGIKDFNAAVALIINQDSGSQAFDVVEGEFTAPSGKCRKKPDGALAIVNRGAPR
jgi:hypothetical protein